MNMHGTSPHQHDDGNDRFDAAMRALHQDALGQLTPSVRWRLKPAAPKAQGGIARRFAQLRVGPVWAGAMAAVFAAAIGVGLWRSTEPTDTVAAPAQVAAEQGESDAATVLGEDPDFYAWLASADADLVAME
jgi:hypothetical protein